MDRRAIKELDRRATRDLVLLVGALVSFGVAVAVLVVAVVGAG